MTTMGEAVHGGNAVEYVAETTFAATPANPAMQWFGVVESFTPNAKSVLADTRYLGAAASDKTENIIQTKVGQSVEVSMRVFPSALTWFTLYGMGSATGTDDTLDSMSIGHVIDNITTAEYAVYRGCVIKSATLTIAKDALLTLDVVWDGADHDGYSTDDYKGTGSHATASTSTLGWSALTALTLGGGALGEYVQALTITIENDLALVHDVGETASTGIDAIILKKRDIKVGLTLDLDNMDMEEVVRAATSQALVATINGEAFTIAGVIFPEFNAEFTGDALVEHTFTSAPCQSITVA